MRLPPSVLCAAVFVLLVISPWVQACESQAKTELEKVFCKIQGRNPQALPYSLHEFRQNPAKTQRLLLKRPAAAAGVDLPQAAPTAKAATQPVRPTVPAERARPQSPAPERAQTSQPSGCELRGRLIRCPDGDYRLAGNLPNSALAPEAFDAKLNLPAYTGAPGDMDEQRRWLADCYREYVTQMTALGLAGSTMSYTRFYHTWREATARGADFSVRMRQMFEFLKKDKASLGVQSHYTDLLPQNLSECVKLNRLLWVCDNVRHNWVYQRDVGGAGG